MWLGVALYESNIDVNGNNIGNLSFLCRFRCIRYGQFDLHYFRPSGAQVCACFTICLLWPPFRSSPFSPTVPTQRSTALASMLPSAPCDELLFWLVFRPKMRFGNRKYAKRTASAPVLVGFETHTHTIGSCQCHWQHDRLLCSMERLACQLTSGANNTNTTVCSTHLLHKSKSDGANPIKWR